MAVNFPSSPNVDDTYSFNGSLWIYDGNGWKISSPAAAQRLTIFGRSTNTSVPVTTGTLNVIGRAGNVSILVSR